MEKYNLHRGQCHRPTLHSKTVGLSLFQELLLLHASRSRMTLPTSTTCSALAPAAMALDSEKTPWRGTDPSSERWGFQVPPRHHRARLAAALMPRHTAAWSNGHCGTKLTVHLLLAADAGERVGCNFVSDPPNNVCCRAVILAINVTAEQIVSAEIFAKHAKTLKPHLSVCVLCMELHAELNKDWMGGEMLRVASQLKCKNSKERKKPAVFISGTFYKQHLIASKRKKTKL